MRSHCSAPLSSFEGQCVQDPVGWQCSHELLLKQSRASGTKQLPTNVTASDSPVVCRLELAPRFRRRDRSAPLVEICNDTDL